MFLDFSLALVANIPLFRFLFLAGLEILASPSPLTLPVWCYLSELGREWRMRCITSLSTQISYLTTSSCFQAWHIHFPVLRCTLTELKPLDTTVGIVLSSGLGNVFIDFLE